jgi:hypothetical protein
VTGKRHQRKAALPGAGYTRPASLDATGLVVTVFGESGGVEGTWDFSRLEGNLALRTALASGFDRMAGPGGTWRSGATARSAHYLIKVFLSDLAGLPEPPQAIEEITPGVWASWRMSLPTGNGTVKKVGVVRAALLASPGLLPETAKALGRRIGNRDAPRVSSYSREDFDQIRGAAARTFNSALVRIRRNREHLRQWYAGAFPKGSPDFLIGEALDCVLRTGDVPRIYQHLNIRRLQQPYGTVLGGTAAHKTWGRLFLTTEETFALTVLLVASEGWNRSVVHRLRIPEHNPAAGELFDIHTVEINKARRPVRLRYTSNNLVDAGPDSPGRLMGHAIEATEVARSALELRGEPTDRLPVCRRASPSGRGLFMVGAPGGEAARQWARQAALLEGDGTPKAVGLQRLRRTVQVRIRKEPTQNSAETHESTYVLPDPAAFEQAQDTIAQGLTEAVDNARAITTMKMILGDDADVLTELADDPELAEKLLSGKLDTATAACVDFTHSPRGEPGQPCPDSFLDCLACPNGIATRRHVPRLAYLHACLGELRGTLDAEVWALDWQQHYARLSSLLDAHTTAAERQAALRGIGNRDHTLVDDFLRRRFDP